MCIIILLIVLRLSLSFLLSLLAQAILAQGMAQAILAQGIVLNQLFTSRLSIGQVGGQGAGVF